MGAVPRYEKTKIDDNQRQGGVCPSGTNAAEHLDRRFIQHPAFSQ
jgi:hypothetical protein